MRTSVYDPTWGDDEDDRDDARADDRDDRDDEYERAAARARANDFEETDGYDWT